MGDQFKVGDVVVLKSGGPAAPTPDTGRRWNG